MLNRTAIHEQNRHLTDDTVDISNRIQQSDYDLQSIIQGSCWCRGLVWKTVRLRRLRWSQQYAYGGNVRSRDEYLGAESQYEVSYCIYEDITVDFGRKGVSYP